MLTSAVMEQALGRTPIPKADCSITARLRAETSAEHQEIERNARLRRLSEDDLGIEEYVSILIRLAGFFGPVEEEIRRWSDRFPQSLDISARLIKTDWLRRDISTLAPRLNWEATASIMCAFGRLGEPEKAWGCLYVLEGATLGGQILARGLNARLGLAHDRGTAFYTSYGSQTGARWQVFKAALTACVADQGLDANEIVSAARATFHGLNAWMEGDQ